MAVRLIVTLAALLSVEAALCDQPRPEKTPAIQGSPAGAEVKRLIAEGTALHDQGDFEGAIASYRKALALDPGNGQALYEIAYSQYKKRDLKAAAATAEEASRAAGHQRMLAVLIGNIQDDLGDSNRAIEAYRKGLETDPDFFLLYFNLGTTYRRLHKLDLARVALENAVSLSPRHPSSHLYLGKNYIEQGYRVPAILALTRFLFLENGTDRSATAIRWIDEIFRAGVQGDGTNQTTITIDPNVPKDEGDFSGADLMIGILQASEKIRPKIGDEPEGPPEMNRLATLLSIVGETGSRGIGKGFAAEYYVPFAVDLSNRKATAAYAAMALRGTKSAAIESWIAGHKAQVEEVTTLASSYAWPPVRPPALASSDEK